MLPLFPVSCIVLISMNRLKYDAKMVNPKMGVLFIFRQRFVTTQLQFKMTINIHFQRKNTTQFTTLGYL